MARGKETKFLTKIVNKFDDLGEYAYKIPDTPNAMGLRFTTKKPYDMAASIGGKFMAIEGKHSSKWEAFGKSAFDPDQIVSMNKLEFKKIPVFIFLQVQVAPNPLKDIKRVNRLYIFSWSELKRYWFINGSIKAVILKNLTHIPYKKGGYDLQRFIDSWPTWEGTKMIEDLSQPE